jgi:nicotinate-nucleotide pyrophosphorylase (carboxylating)
VFREAVYHFGMTFSPSETVACRKLLELALAEDIGESGDRTSLSTISAETVGQAALIARAPGVIAGLSAASMVCAAVDPNLHWLPEIVDGTVVEKGKRIAVLSGNLRNILTAERTALNFLQRLSGIATLTHKYVELVSGTSAQVLDTRKTTPGWRLLEKYAVRCGGGTNHRVGLYDAILIKDNHIAGLGDPNTAVRRAVELARAYPGNANLPVEVEVDSVAQFQQVLPAKPEIVLLDNMPATLLRECVSIRDRFAPTVKLEASGGVNLATIRSIAETGVDRISVGAITHSATALDIALDYLK